MKTKKYLKIASLVVVAAIFIWTFVFLYQKSQPKVKVYETIVPEIADLEKTTVATGKVEPRDEVLIKPQISGIISEVYKEAGQSIRQGEVIAKVKVIPELGTLNSAESRVRLADINARQAETDFARIEKLFNDKLISDEEYEPDATREEVIEAAKAARIHRFITQLPYGYDTIISGDGMNISQGQKQMLTIARAMLSDAKMLILDEATSNVDTRTEQQIQAAMRNLMKGRTCFVIAHRLSTIQNADEILVVQQGEIVEQGNHQQLMERGGVYAGLYRSQFQ